MLIGLTLTATNIIQAEKQSAKNPSEPTGKLKAQATLQPDGCYGEPLDCVINE